MLAPVLSKCLHENYVSPQKYLVTQVVVMIFAGELVSEIN